MIQEEIVIQNSTLYDKDGLPYVYKGIPLSKITLHKLAGYSGQLHGPSNAIIKAEQKYRKKALVFKLRKVKRLKNLLKFNQYRQDSKLFFGNGYINGLKDFYISQMSDYLSTDYGSSLDGKNELPITFPQNAYIFLATMNNYLNPMIPVINELLIQKKEVLLLLPLSAKGWNNFSKIVDYNIIYLEDLFEKDIKIQFDQISNEILANFNKALPIFRKNVKYGKLKYFDVFRKNFERVYIDYIPLVHAYIDICENIIKRYNPKALIVARLRRPVEVSFSEVFQKYKLPIYMLIHGHISDDDSRHFDDGYFDIVDKIFVWGEWQKEILLNKKYENVKNEQIIVAGNPAWQFLRDKIRNNDFLSFDFIKKELGLKRKYIIITTDYSLPINGYKRAVKAINSLNQYDIVIKIHPEEDKKRYNCVGFKNTTIIKNIEKIDLHSLFNRSEMVLTHGSTTNLEAVECGTAVGVLDFAEFKKELIVGDFTDNEVKVFHNTTELICNLKKAIKIKPKVAIKANNSIEIILMHILGA